MRLGVAEDGVEVGGCGVVTLTLTALALDNYEDLCNGCRHPRKIVARNVIHSTASSGSALTIGSAADFNGLP